MLSKSFQKISWNFLPVFRWGGADADGTLRKGLLSIKKQMSFCRKINRVLNGHWCDSELQVFWWIRLPMWFMLKDKDQEKDNMDFPDHLFHPLILKINQCFQLKLMKNINIEHHWGNKVDYLRIWGSVTANTSTGHWFSSNSFSTTAHTNYLHDWQCKPECSLLVRWPWKPRVAKQGQEARPNLGHMIYVSMI